MVLIYLNNIYFFSGEKQQMSSHSVEILIKLYNIFSLFGPYFYPKYRIKLKDKVFAQNREIFTGLTISY